MNKYILRYTKLFKKQRKLLENAEHKHKIEIIELEHKNELTRKDHELESSAMYKAVGDLFANPEKISELLKVLNNPTFK